MTLVEVMVAMLVLTVVLSAMASVLITSLHSLVGNENRVRANALANAILEDLQERRWEFVGFAEDDYDGIGPAPASTVIIEPGHVDYDDWEASAAEDWDQSERVLPQMTASRDGVSFEIAATIRWAADDPTNDDEAYKQFNVTVSWTDYQIDRTVTHEALRAGPPADPGFGGGFTTIGQFPDVGYIDSPHDSDPGKLRKKVELNEDGEVDSSPVVLDDLLMDIETSCVADDVQVSFVDRSGDVDNPVDQPLQSDGDDDRRWWLGTGIFEGWRFQNGDTTFTFTAMCGDNEIESTRSVRYVYEDVAIDDVVFDGPEDEDGNAAVCLDQQGEVTEDTEVTLMAHGVTAEDDLIVVGPGFEEGDVVPVEAETVDGIDYVLRWLEGDEFHADPATTVTLSFELIREFDQKTAGHELDLRVGTNQGGDANDWCD